MTVTKKILVLIYCILFLGIVSAGYSTEPVKTAGNINRYIIQGTIVDGTRHGQEEAFEKLEAAKSFKELDEIFNKEEPRAEPSPMANVKIKLKGEFDTREVLTDKEGKFEFSNLEGMFFEISSDIPLQTRVGEQVGALPQKVILDYNKYFGMTYDSNFISITGKVTDANDQPIAGVEITAIYNSKEIAFQQYLDNHEAPKWRAVTNNKGVYDLTAIGTANFHALSGYLCSGRLGSYVEIHANANGFQQDPNSMPQVPPIISEEALKQARRFLKWIHKTAVGEENQEMMQLTEKKDIKLPCIKGNTISGVDIKLKKL